MGRIIIVSFSYLPSRTVGVLRIAYWFEYLKNKGYDVTLITAEKIRYDDPSIISIEPNESAYIKDKSFNWGKKVKSYLINNFKVNKGDVILMTGGPFLHFPTIVSIKREYPFLKIIADYRDPLTHNPRNKNIFKIAIKYLVERYVNQRIDCAISVNPICERMLVSSCKSVVIDNGFDEHYFTNHVNEKKYNAVVYAGKFYLDTNPNIMLKALGQCDFIDFYYLGLSEIVVNSPNVHYLGVRDYSFTASKLLESSIGIVLTGGKSFESTTKIFDYIGANMKILIITEGEIHSGNIHSITQDNPNVYWCKNTIGDIKSALGLLIKKPFIPYDNSKYSRENGALKLESIIRSL